MVKMVLILLVFFSLNSFAQKANKGKWVEFKTLFKMSNATKDGFYCNGYVVNIDWDLGKKYDGKIIIISGKMQPIKGLGKHNYTGSGKTKLHLAGRVDDYLYIGKPSVRLFKKP